MGTERWIRVVVSFHPGTAQTLVSLYHHQCKIRSSCAYTAPACYSMKLDMRDMLVRFRSRPLLDKNGKLFGKYDIFIPLFVLIVLVLGFFIARVLLQKETYVTAELFASGGEWWWNNPAPPHWLTDPIQKGSIEYDPQGNVLVEVVDTQKFEAGDRKMLWMKVRLLVTPMKGSRQYRFRREPLQVGS